MTIRSSPNVSPVNAPTPTGSMPRRCRFRSSWLYWPGGAITFGVAVLVGFPLLLLGSFTKNGPPLILALVWITFCALASAQFLRVAFELELDGETLRWRAPRRSGSTALSNIRAIYSDGPSSNFVRIDLIVGPRISVVPHLGLQDFVDVLVARRPDLPVRLGRIVQLRERMGLISGFEVLGGTARN